MFDRKVRVPVGGNILPADSTVAAMFSCLIRRCFSVVLPLFVIGFALFPFSATAQRAALLVDADSDTVLHADHALRPARPASLTKLMTLYLAFEAMRDGRFEGDTALPVSAVAAGQAPVKLGLKRGGNITLEDAITALIVMSGNDVAVVVAEAIGGSEEAFAAMMNAAANRLGLERTVFRNASGLPNPGQITTARDMVVLAQALRRTFPEDFARFATKTFTFKGRRINSHNNFLRGFDGALGMKTGFTCRAGYNLVAAAERNGRHLIGVVLGDASAGARDARMVRLMKKGFANDAEPLFVFDAFPDRIGQGESETVNGRMIATGCINPQPGREYFKVREWSVLLGGIDLTRRAALVRARQFMRDHRSLLKGGRPMLLPRWARDVTYQIGITGLKKQNATNTCLGIRSKQVYCVVRSPKAAEYAMQKGLRIIAAVEKKKI